MTAGGFGTSGEPPIELRGFSLAGLALALGVLITAASFTEFFITAGSQGLSGIGFVYGIPIALIGCALKYAELEPVGIQTTPEAEELFEAKATPTMSKIVKDVTRHRYGDEAHLDTSVKALGLWMGYGNAYPQLEYVKFEKSKDVPGEVAFSMVFKSLETPFRVWNEKERIEAYDRFFGPDCWAQVDKISAEEKLVAIKLTTGERPARYGVWDCGFQDIVVPLRVVA